jgi:anti-sigma factor RsiW
MSVSPDERVDQVEGWRGSLSRRSFLHRGALTAAAVAVAGSVPGLSGLVASTAPEAPAVDASVNEAADDSGVMTEPLVAQVKDLTTGEISLFQGEREVVVRSPELARSLLSAAQK